MSEHGSRGQGLVDMTGQRFERWVVLSRADNSPSGEVRWNCLCDCGSEGVACGHNLRSGSSRSCGCLMSEYHASRRRDESANPTLEEKRRRIRQAKARPCMDCRVSYPYFVMDFDHRPDENKLFGVNASVYRPWPEILAEMAKCDLVCANCHRYRTQSRSKGHPQPRRPGRPLHD